MHYYFDVLKKYAVFKGRATRSEYWYFILFNIIVSIILGFISKMIGDQKNILGNIYTLIVFIPNIAVTIRRLHDIGRTGWWLLLFIVIFFTSIIFSFIPLLLAGFGFFNPNLLFILLFSLGIFIWSTIWMCTDSQPLDNKYGPNPKGVQSDNPPTPTIQPTTSQFVKYDNPSTPPPPTPTSPQPEQPTNTQ